MIAKHLLIFFALVACGFIFQQFTLLVNDRKYLQAWTEALRLLVAIYFVFEAGTPRKQPASVS